DGLRRRVGDHKTLQLLRRIDYVNPPWINKVLKRNQMGRGDVSRVWRMNCQRTSRSVFGESDLEASTNSRLTPSPALADTHLLQGITSNLCRVVPDFDNEVRRKLEIVP